MEVPDTDWNREDWVKIFQPFDEHDGLNYDGAFGSAEARLKRDLEALIDDSIPEEMDEEEVIEELDRGIDYPEGDLSYSLPGLEGSVRLYYRPPGDEGNVVRGEARLDLDFVGDGPSDTWEQMVEEHGTEYLFAPRDNHPDQEILDIRIPENYDEETLNETVESVVKLSRNAVELDSELAEVAEEYEFDY